MKNSHSPLAIAKRLLAAPKQNYLRDWIYGGIDGAVTTFAVVSGVTGAELSSRTILILGVANLVADGFSMAASNWLGTRAEQDRIRQIEMMEQREIRETPEDEREEVRQLLARQGLRSQTLENAVLMITQSNDNWVQFMLRAKHGLALMIHSPWKAAGATFVAFIVCGAAPLVPYLITTQAFFASSVLTALVFFGVGSLKSHWSVTNWWKSGLSTLAVGSIAAALAYGVGRSLKIFI